MGHSIESLGEISINDIKALSHFKSFGKLLDHLGLLCPGRLT